MSKFIQGDNVKASNKCPQSHTSTINAASNATIKGKSGRKYIIELSMDGHPSKQQLSLPSEYLDLVVSTPTVTSTVTASVPESIVKGTIVVPQRPFTDYESGSGCEWDHDNKSEFIGERCVCSASPDLEGDVAITIVGTTNTEWFPSKVLIIEGSETESVPDEPINEPIKQRPIVVGDTVKVLRIATTREGDWNNAWASEMDKCVGLEFEVVKLHGSNGVGLLTDQVVESNYAFPEFVLELVEVEVEEVIEEVVEGPLTEQEKSLTKYDREALDILITEISKELDVLKEAYNKLCHAKVVQSIDVNNIDKTKLVDITLQYVHPTVQVVGPGTAMFIAYGDLITSAEFDARVNEATNGEH